MKKTLVLLISALLLIAGGCKTTEANYKAAYEKAKNKGKSDALDPEVYDKIEQEQAPAELTMSGVSFPGRIMYMMSVSVEGIPNGKINKYSVTAAKFKQLFNAKMMTRSLQERGFGEAFVAKDRDDYYYVVAESDENPESVVKALEKLKDQNSGILSPFPYVIVRP